MGYLKNEAILEQEYYQRQDWLKDFGVQEKDVLVDDSGEEFIFIENETDHSDVYQVELNKVKVPFKNPYETN